MPERSTVKGLETQVALVKKDVNQIGNLFVKLEIALDKITDVNNTLGQILAVHENRVSAGETAHDKMKDEIVDVQKKVDTEIKDLHSRLTTNTREIEHKMSEEVDKVLLAIQDLKIHIDNKTEKLERRIAALEKWRWIILGAFAAGGWLLGNGVTFASLLAF